MHHKTHYATVTDAINKLKSEGFTTEFIIKENSIRSGSTEIQSDDLEIVDVYRYEGDTDPSDEAIVYALESTSGIKGIVVNGFGIYADPAVSKVLKKIRLRK